MDNLPARQQSFESDFSKVCSDYGISPEDRDILSMIDDGFTYEEIGNEYGVTKQAISLRIKKIQAKHPDVGLDTGGVMAKKKVTRQYDE